jgi:hypothetical protein
MIRFTVSEIALILLCLMLRPTIAQAVEIIRLQDHQDDAQRIEAVSKQESVRKFAEELGKFREKMLAKDQEELRRDYGPSAMYIGDWAMPVAQPRTIALPGLRNGGATTYSEWYVFKDAALKFWFISDRPKPVAMVVYFLPAKGFPKLNADNLSTRLAWDREHFQRMVKAVEERAAKK